MKVSNFINSLTMIIGIFFTYNILIILSNLLLFFSSVFVPLTISNVYVLLFLGIFLVPSIFTIFELLDENTPLSYTIFQNFFLKYKKNLIPGLKFGTLHFIVNAVLYTSLIQSLYYSFNQSFFYFLLVILLIFQLVFLVSYLIVSHYKITKHIFKVLNNALWLIFSHPWVSIRMISLVILEIALFYFLQAAIASLLTLSVFLWLIQKNWILILRTLEKIEV